MPSEDFVFMVALLTLNSGPVRSSWTPEKGEMGAADVLRGFAAAQRRKRGK